MGVLEKIRSQDKAKRRMYAMIATGVFMVIIIIFWIMGMAGRFERSQEDTPEGARPFQIIGNMFSSGFQQFQEERPRMRDALDENNDPSFNVDDVSDEDLPSTAEILETIRQNIAIENQENQEDSEEDTVENGSDEAIVINGIEIVEVED